MPTPLRVAYTLEQCWHEHPGGTAIAALRIADELAANPQIELHAVAGRHAQPPHPAFRPALPVAQLPLARPWLYETWLRLRWPRVESVTGAIDVCHATGLVPAATAAPLVVTLHDLAFERYPDRFTGHGVKVMRRSLDRIRRHADLVLCSSEATMDDVEGSGIGRDRLRHVPLGVAPRTVDAVAVAAVRDRHSLPDAFVLFLGTIEPRKNLVRLADAVARLDPPLPLVVGGADGWGDVAGRIGHDGDVRFLGFVPPAELPALYASATVFAYPSEWEGFGLPVAEAMAQGTPVVTSRGISTEEVAGGAAVLVDPLDVGDIRRGLSEALADGRPLADAGRARATELTWARSAELTVAAYREVAR